jgi:N-acetylglucosaminyldiphosphoundecaprenol N-acetyl-beta-D-mannosaminyltransferase
VNSRSDPNFREALLLSDLCPADGMPIVWIARLLGIPINNRIAGSDIFNARRGGQGGRLGVEPPAGRGFEGLILIRGARVISVDYAARLLGRALGCPDPRHELVET